MSNELKASVLIVDDQPDVVQGMADGIRWKKLGVQHLYLAYSVSEAQEIFRQHPIHLLLCDIEMPPSNGFELLRWVRENGYSAKCIFLSAHAEFEYAQEAVKLGSFDYILQPAPYSDIEQAVSHALDKYRQEQQQEETYQMGLYWQQKEEMVVESCIRSYLSGEESFQHLMEDFHSLSIPLLPDTDLCLILIQLLPAPGSPIPDNMREQLRRLLTLDMGRDENTVLLTRLEPDAYLAVLYGGRDEWEDLPSNLQEALDQFHKESSLRLACYMGTAIQPSRLSEEYSLLASRKSDNVAGYSGIFTPSQRQQISNYTYSFPNMEHWAQALSQGNCDTVRAEAVHYLQQQKERGALTGEFLAKFHQDFIQMFFTVAKNYETRTHDIFYKEYPFEDFLQAYTSYDKMLALVEFAVGYVEKKLGHETERTPIERAMDYIRQNIERDLSRTEIADAIFLSPEYLSRLFKKELGISLGDFILSEKMSIAKSLLADTGIPVSLVATRVGYSNFSYFSQVFRKTTGMSPNEYRQAHRLTAGGN